MKRSFLLAGFFLLVFTLISKAEEDILRDRFVITPYIGYHLFASDRLVDNKYKKFENGFYFGLGVEKFFGKYLNFEFNLGIVPTDERIKKKEWKSTKVLVYSLQASYHFKATKRFYPYVLVGVGGVAKLTPGLDYGFGLRMILTKNIALKTEFKQFWLQNGVFDNLITFGVSYLWGKPVVYKKARPKLIDNDNDGVLDEFDECPNTPQGIAVDERGCPLDSDGDGVPDYQDKCPFTPEGIAVDREGCPLDSDGDGVPDYLDKCPNTPKGTAVYSDGCPLDTDEDGVPDYLDKCPDTPMGVAVNDEGCPYDADRDGVPDNIDQCPNTPEGAEVDERGCMKKITLTIQFDPNSTVVKQKYYDELRRIAEYMKANPEVKIEVQGHTDRTPRSSYEYNMRLSQKRAEAVKRVLVEKFGIDPDRIVAKGYGYTRPIAPNDTPEGRAKNRRVEIVVIE